MASIPASELAQEVLDACLKDGTWPGRALDDLIERALDEDDLFRATAATRALFGIVIERLGDLFEPQLCDVYARLFSHVIGRALPEYKAEDLVTRYNRIRQVRRFPGGEVQRVFVLSRVTLGADIAVTSAALSAAKQRFPDAEICLVGPAKNAELFAEDARIVPIAVMYGRSSLLRDRLLAAAELQVAVDELSAIVIDPDSRLTQLGLIPICDDARYYFFESRAFGGGLDGTLSSLTTEWLSEVFETPGACSYIAPLRQERVADVTVSWGVGDNDNKRVDCEFEQRVLSGLVERGRSVLLDCGAGGAEAERARELAARIARPELLHLHEGSYGSFASHIMQSRLYIGYDSAGQHVAAAAGVPLISIFGGYVCERMLSRWTPANRNARIIPFDDNCRASVLDRTLRAIIAAEGAAASAASTD